MKYPPKPCRGFKDRYRIPYTGTVQGKPVTLGEFIGIIEETGLFLRKAHIIDIKAHDDLQAKEELRRKAWVAHLQERGRPIVFTQEITDSKFPSITIKESTT